MREVAKLRSRLKNVQRNVTEYRMTVKEAKALLAEIDNLLSNAAEKKLPKEVVIEPVQTTRIIDGGTF